MGGLRSALIAAGAGLAWLPAIPVGADAVEVNQPWVRVLLTQGRDPVRVGGHRYTAVEPGRLRRNGHPVGQRVVVNGPTAVGKLRYRGRIEVSRSAEGVTVINEVPVERYVEGILLREVYPGWEAAVLQAQAVVARTYVLHRSRETRGRAWDVTSGTGSQVYGGIDAEAPQAARAVRATEGQVLVFGGKPILAAYHSASGGRTASSEEVWGRALPYLVSVPVEGEEVSPDTYWRIPVSTAKLGRALKDLGWPVGAVEEVGVLERSQSGRVRRAFVEGSRKRIELSGHDLRRAVGGLPSTLFEVKPEEDGFLFVGSGHGHGVGMSQWGARAMAQRGASYREILAWFYPGAGLREEWGSGEEL